MRLIDRPFTGKEKRGTLDMLNGNIARICVSDDPQEIMRHLGFATDRLSMLAYSRMMELPAAAPTEQLARLQKAFALACRILGDSRWARWQEHIMERVDSEQVCRVCGCTQDNACLGGCYWVEDDLCSQCAAKLDEEPTP